jgi:hypothetical protein
VLSAVLATSGRPALAGADPYASNNGLLPPHDAYGGPLRTLSADYPDPGVPAPERPAPWTGLLAGRPVTVGTAPAYVDALKAYVAPSMRAMVTEPGRWDPAEAGWYGMIWTGAAVDGAGWSGREAILGAFDGQILPASTYAGSGLTVDIQNHTVVYYNDIAARTLARIWEDPFVPRPEGGNAQFEQGAMVVKAAGVTATPEQWPVVAGSAVWNVYRPPFDLHGPIPGEGPVVTPLRVMQFDIVVKDAVAAPETGWVFSTFVYDKDAPGADAFDRLVPLGATWGNDPDVTAPRGARLAQTWINPRAPAYATVTLGWGGRMSGPIDVAERTNVRLVDGTQVPVQRASACLSCHGTAEFPSMANFYPSPNVSLPRAGDTFLMHVPGSPAWMTWFRNKAGDEAQNAGLGTVALDYDLLVEAAVNNFNAAVGNDLYVQRRVPGH